MDIATLGLAVKPTGIKQAGAELRGLTAEADRAERSASGLAKAWGKALGASVLAGTAIAVVGVKKYLANTIEAEKVQAQLEARIRSTGAAAGLAINDLNRMALALQAATTFDDESIGEAQALLLTFTRIGREVFPRATEAVLDMSVALGGDLKSAALQVGKALNDPVLGVTALAKAGVQFSETQKKLIKDMVETGNVAGAQVIVLKELESQMGGSARAARDTLGGALTALGNTFENLLEGEAGDGGLRGARDGIEALNKTLNDPGIKRGVDSAVDGVLQIANSLVTLIAKLGEAGSALAEFFGDYDQKSRISLDNERERLSTQLSIQQRQAARFAFVPGLGAAAQFDMRNTKAEIAKVDAEISKRIRASLFDDVRATRDSTESLGRAGSGSAASTAGVSRPAGGRGRARSVKADLAEAFDASAALDRVQSRMMEKLGQVGEAQRNAIGDWAKLRAELAGPLKEAELEHIERLLEIEALGKKAGATAAEIEAAKNREAQAYARVTESIKEQQFQMANPERMQLMDEFRRSSADTLTDIVTGARSAKDAIADFAKSFEQQITALISKRLFEQLFGEMGTSGQDTKGGQFLGSLLGGLFGTNGGGFASGGFTGVGGKYEPAGIVHKGEYVLNADATRVLPRGYLDRLNAGQVPSTANPVRATTNVVQNFTQVIQGEMTGRTAEQAARANGREARRGLARTGG